MKKQFAKLCACAVLITASVFGVAGCADGDGGETGSETFTGVVSAETYDTRETALQAFLTAETETWLRAKYVKDEKKGELTSGEIAELNLTDGERNGLAGGEKVLVTYKQGREEGSGSVTPSPSPDPLPTPAQYAHTYSEEKTYTQTAYLLNYGSAYRYYTPLPEVGETLTNSYYESVVGSAQYENYTFTGSASQKTVLGDEEETYFSEAVTAKVTQKGIYRILDQEERYISPEQRELYVYNYGNALQDQLSQGQITWEEIERMLEEDYQDGVSWKLNTTEYRIFGTDDVYSVAQATVTGDFRREYTPYWDAQSMRAKYDSASGGMTDSEWQAYVLDHLRSVYNTRYGLGDFLGLEINPFRLADFGCGGYVKTENGFTLSQDTIDEANDERYSTEMRKFNVIVVEGRIGKIAIDCDFAKKIVGWTGEPVLDDNGNPLIQKATFTFDGSFSDFGRTEYTIDAEAESAYREYLA